MKTTDFATYLTEFLKIYLPGKRQLSENTIMAYRDTFRLMLIYAENECEIAPEKLAMVDFTDDFVFGFIQWLEKTRHSSQTTRKQRLAAIHAFVHFIKARIPDYLLEYQKILELHIKASPQQNVGYFSAEQVKKILHSVNTETKYGRRDMVMLALLYDAALRVQEICDLRIADIRLQRPCTVTVVGKGKKQRIVPIMSETAVAIEKYLSNFFGNYREQMSSFAFINHEKTALTRAGVAYILKKYCNLARKQLPSIPLRVSPHMLRHSKAMHLLKEGTNLIYIRDFLGHSQIATTEVYAKADVEMKRAVIDKNGINIVDDYGDWKDDASLMAMLTDLCK